MKTRWIKMFGRGRCRREKKDNARTQQKRDEPKHEKINKITIYTSAATPAASKSTVAIIDGFRCGIDNLFVAELVIWLRKTNEISFNLFIFMFNPIKLPN